MKVLGFYVRLDMLIILLILLGAAYVVMDAYGIWELIYDRIMDDLSGSVYHEIEQLLEY